MIARVQICPVADRVVRKCHQILEKYQEQHFSHTGDNRMAIARIAEELGELSKAERNGQVDGDHGMIDEAIDVAATAVLLAAGLIVRGEPRTCGAVSTPTTPGSMPDLWHDGLCPGCVWERRQRGEGLR